jgi:[histone H3]-lysine36 N-dimethyltransferase SETMAR
VIKMTSTKYEIRVLLRHYWKRKFSTRDACKEICEFEGEGIVAQRTAAKWFKRFNDGDLNLEDKPRPGRPSLLCNDELITSLEDNPSSSSRDLAINVGVHQTTILRHLHQLDFKHKKPRQDPHYLTEEQARNRVDMCKKLLENPLDDRFWRHIVTSDEKWIYLVNHNREKCWVPKGQYPPSVPRQSRFARKILLSVWWNFEGILHFELVPNSKAINAELYCQQLDRVYDALKLKYPVLLRRKQALFHQDNAKPHTARITKEKFEQLEGVEILPHPAYSPDAAPSDYGLFRSMQHFLKGRRFESEAEVEVNCKEFFESKQKNWYYDQIRMLADRWRKIIEADGLYFEE